MDLLGCENSVAGSILISPCCLPLVAASLSPEDFALSKARTVFETALELSSEGVHIDAVTVQARAKQNGILLSNTYLAELMNATPSAANIEAYVELVKGEGLKRRLLELFKCAEERADRGASSNKLISELTEALGALFSGSNAQGLINSAELFDSWSKFRQKRLENLSFAVLKTGFSELDNILGSGMVNGGLYIIGGRPGIGKTTLGLSMALNIAKTKKPILFVSLEMNCVQIASKLIAQRAALDYSKVYQGELSENESKKAFDAASSLSHLPLHLCSNSQLSVSEIILLARGIKGLRAIFIDYLGLIMPRSGKNPSRYEAMTEISSSLKRAASALGIPLICIAQLNRELAGRKSKRPMLTDLRDSGSLEQDADGVIFVHRPSYYDSEITEHRGADSEVIELIVAKNRHGETGVCEMLWNGSTGRIYGRSL